MNITSIFLQQLGICCVLIDILYSGCQKDHCLLIEIFENNWFETIRTRAFLLPKDLIAFLTFSVLMYSIKSPVSRSSSLAPLSKPSLTKSGSGWLRLRALPGGPGSGFLTEFSQPPQDRSCCLCPLTDSFLSCTYLPGL